MRCIAAVIVCLFFACASADADQTPSERAIRDLLRENGFEGPYQVSVTPVPEDSGEWIVTATKHRRDGPSGSCVIEEMNLEARAVDRGYVAESANRAISLALVPCATVRESDFFSLDPRLSVVSALEAARWAVAWLPESSQTDDGEPFGVPAVSREIGFVNRGSNGTIDVTFRARSEELHRPLTVVVATGGNELRIVGAHFDPEEVPIVLPR
jgi:hypothetical protein